ncbi:MAG TPA: clostripain-related cysteine peptidase [Candidatus Eisenbacteria bacterium]|jgi:hypothetical protein
MPRTRARSLPRRDWSFLAYIAGDNDLSDNGLEDIQEMCDIGSSRRLHAAVEIDTRGEHTGSIRYEITEPDPTGVAHRTVIERLPERDTGAPETLRAFLKWGLTRYPARERLVVVWNHGAGFRTVRRDIAYDDYGTSLDMPEIERAMHAAGIRPSRRVTILGFDACLMNMLEVVHHLADQVKIVVGSQQTEPGDGWPYDRVIEAMKKPKRPEALARSIVRTYIQDYRRRGDSNVTQSAVVAERTEPAVAALSDLGKALVGILPDGRGRLSGVRSKVQSYEFADYVDLIHCVRLIRDAITRRGIKGLARRVETKTRKAILANGWYGRGVSDSHGLSIWFPSDRRTYLDYRGKYLALNFARKHRGWIEFLDAFHA